jgi:predicted TPR repeat methyltransferase
MLRAGRLEAVRPLLTALRRVAPASPDVAEIEARLLRHDGRLSDAVAALSAALVSYPDNHPLLLYRAELRLGLGEVLGAADDAAAAVMIAPGDVSAKALLGVALIQLGRFDEAMVCLRESVAAAPLHPGFRCAFAHALDRLGRRDEARAMLLEGVSRNPGSVELRVAAIMTAMRQDKFAEAAELAEAACHAGAADARVFGLLGHAMSLMGRDDAAADAYEEALKLAPEDHYVRYLVAASGRRQAATRAPAVYIETVFDGYAGQFEDHLIGLGYRVPGLVRAALLRHRPGLGHGEAVGPVLDLGCGTGLVGVVLSDLPVRDLTGIDLSARMIERARAKNLYQSLRHEDIEAALGLMPGHPPASAHGKWAIIVAADSLCYFGDLAAVMAGAFERLRPGGLFIFSVEDLASARPDANSKAAWLLGPRGRYAHRANALETMAATAGFETRELRRETLRIDRGAEIAGLIMVLARPR